MKHKPKPETVQKLSNSSIDKILDLLLYLISFIYILLCPYTKVEESFNLQACHDILYLGSDVENYDHHKFPGVVPRSFIGPLALSSVVYPFTILFNLLNINKVYTQYLVRGALSFIVVGAFNSYRRAVKIRLGCGISRWVAVLTLSQFHFLFYSSRPLPNIFALIMVLLALTAWMREKPRLFVFISAGAILIFRGELALFLGTIVFMELIVFRLTLVSLIATGLLASATWLPLTILVDSFFWNRWLWPEGEVLYFNVILNKSSQWGVMPWAWYFLSALPRSMASSLLMVPLAPLVDGRTFLLLFPSLFYVFLYSFLPHKELRFIIYVLPLLNTAVAAVCHKIFSSRNSRLCMLLTLGLLGHLVVNCVGTVGLTYVSSRNYPGGEAMNKLHQLEVDVSDASVHLDVYSCQTGISRFGETRSDWRYSKEEGLSTAELRQFTHLLVEGSDPKGPEVSPFSSTHKIIGHSEAFSGFSINYRKLPPVEVKTKPAIYILKKLED